MHQTLHDQICDDKYNDNQLRILYNTIHYYTYLTDQSRQKRYYEGARKEHPTLTSGGCNYGDSRGKN